MTSVLASKGQIVIPKSVRDELELCAGDDFEVYVADGEIVLRPLPKGKNEGLSEVLSNPPSDLEIPPRAKDLPREPLKF